MPYLLFLTPPLYICATNTTLFTMSTKIRVSDATHRRLRDMKAEKIKNGDYENYSFDDLVNELLDNSKYNV